jgi:hypothetical protein
LLSLQGVASPSLLNHGRAGLDCIEGHSRAPTKTHESGVYDSGGAHDFPRAQGSHIPRSGGGMRRDMHDVLQAGICCTITPIYPLFDAILWLGTTSLDPLEDRMHGGLCDPVQGLYGD